MTRYEHILQTLEGLHPSDLMYLWNDRCGHHKYYGEIIRPMDDFDELERPYDPEQSFSQQIESIKIDFADFNIHDRFYNCDDLDHYHSFNSLEAGNSPFDMKELAEDIDEYLDYYYRADTLCYLSNFDWLHDEWLENDND